MKRGEETRTVILNAACDVFAQVGYDRASIREICAKAKTNLASVYYHFRDKKGLYEAVVEKVLSGHIHIQKDFIEHMSDDPRENIRRFIGMFRAMMNSVENAKWFHGIAIAEFDNPTVETSRELENLRVLMERKLADNVRKLLPADYPESRIELITGGIVGQCIHLFRIAKLVESNQDGFSDLTEVHIYQYNLAAIEGIVFRNNTES